jgi:hypothetical protein
MSRHAVEMIRNAKERPPMLTPDTLAQLSPPDRLARLQAEALAHYGTGRNHTAIARDFDLHRTTVQTWLDHPERVPAAVILCLAAWNERSDRLAALSGVLSNRAADLKQLSDEVFQLSERGNK